MDNKTVALLGIGAVALIIVSAGASMILTRNALTQSQNGTLTSLTVSSVPVTDSNVISTAAVGSEPLPVADKKPAVKKVAQVEPRHAPVRNHKDTAYVPTRDVAPMPVRSSSSTSTQSEQVIWNDGPAANGTAQQSANVQTQAAQPQALPPCNDRNVVGALAGGAAGGIAGAQFGKGNGKLATTVLGTVGGALLGSQVIPTQNITCR